LNLAYHGARAETPGFNITLEKDLDPTIGAVEIFPQEISRVLVNLVNNGFYAAHKRAQANPGFEPTLRLRTRNLDGQVEIRVRDNGTGIPADVREKIFEPFFTTKPKGVGTGLGLSTVYGIVRQEKGWIWVRSAPGKGSTFEIYLPRIAAPVRVETEVTAAPLRPSGAETVLVAEDQAQVRRLAADALRSFGYQVIEAENGAEALELANHHPGIIHLLLTDVVMPEMGGRELAERLRTTRPETRVLYMSGYTGDPIAHQVILDCGLAYLPKPFTLDTLASKVRATLESERGG
jgi:CheY-like chemotaxis protein